MPATCPVCGTPVVRDEGAVRIYCPNPKCPARLAQEFGHFAGRGGMDIEGAGWAVLEQLLERGLVKTRGDFFRLTTSTTWMSLDRFARKSAENLKASIERSRRRPLARILNAPRHSPGRRADRHRPGRLDRRALAGGGHGSGRMDGARGPIAARTVTAEEFQEVPGIGAVVAGSIAGYFGAPKRRPCWRTSSTPG
jgi:DNA ligase (NAD+)